MAPIWEERQRKKTHWCREDKRILDHHKKTETHRESTVHQRQKKPERNSQCPIYIHEFNKNPNPSLNNRFSFRKIDNAVSVVKKDLTKNQSQKKVLNRIEETYWATWKPNTNYNKEKSFKTLSGPQFREEHIEEPKKENKPYGDVAQQLINFFNKSSCTSANSVAGNLDKQDQIKEINSIQSPIKITTFPLTPSMELLHEQESVFLKTLEKQSGQTLTSQNVTSNVNSFVQDNELDDSQIVPKAEENDISTNLTAIKHIDSFIINTKKKQELNRNDTHFQQPKCIKLYKKTATNHYVKGGTYPLKSFSKRGSTTKGNFRLGPPGQLVVTGNSLSKR